MGFQKYVMRGVYVHMEQVATADVHRATGNVESGAPVRQPLLVLRFNILSLMNIACGGKYSLMGKR
jgi:hypothetical protein